MALMIHFDFSMEHYDDTTQEEWEDIFLSSMDADEVAKTDLDEVSSVPDNDTALGLGGDREDIALFDSNTNLFAAADSVSDTQKGLQLSPPPQKYSSLGLQEAASLDSKNANEDTIKADQIGQGSNYSESDYMLNDKSEGNHPAVAGTEDQEGHRKDLLDQPTIPLPAEYYPTMTHEAFVSKLKTKSHSTMATEAPLAASPGVSCLLP